MALIIVESPTKARTFNRILKSKDWGGEYYVFATVGHFRDLPAKEMSVDIEHDFKPTYEIMEKKQAMVEKLQDLAKDHDRIILATDLDREGESISYHVAQLLGYIKEDWPTFDFSEKGKVERIVFHEITPKALQEALEHPQELRTDLVKAQQARRILDRVVGYQLSPLLWKKTGKNWLSAGRVQTVALRLIVEREKEIEKFKLEPYVQIFGLFETAEELKAKLVDKDGVVYEVKTKVELFDGTYEYVKTTIDVEQAKKIEADLRSDTFTIKEIKEDVVDKYPPPPYTTSLLQQDSFQKLGFPSKLTMRLAQSLYEKGLITYHRTDSFNLSAQYVFPAKDYIAKKYGAEYALEKPRGFRTKSKNAQEAHEAIRPTRVERALNDIEGKKLNAEEKKLYDLIFRRALATQMKEAKVKQITMTISTTKSYNFEAVSQQVLFDGYMKVAMPEFAEKHKSAIQYTQGTTMTLKDVELQEKDTRPPWRYNEATLIRTMEEKGIGRPSTYASIIALISDKHYVEKERRYFKPSLLGTAISDYLSAGFPDIFNLTFTAKMEDGLDDIANGDQQLLTLLQDFYKPFSAELSERQKETNMIEVAEDVDPDPCPNCGGKVIARYGKFGKFYACGNYPTCKYIKQNLKFVTPEQLCPDCGGRIAVKYSFKTHKRFYGCENYPKCKYVKFALNAEGKQMVDKPKVEKPAKKVVKKKTTKRKTVKKKTTAKKAPAKKTATK
ncbi:MAG: type I DNA topoisomerase [Weeksellaceae bacterium]